MFRRILVVCTGNICRSPMAEALLRDLLQPGQQIASAGVAALIGAPADPHAVAVMAAHGVDISGHRAQQASTPLLAGSDLVLALDATHRDWILSRYPQLRGRVHLLGRWSDDADVADPYMRPRSAFEQTYAEIERHIGDWRPRLALRRSAATAG